MRLLTPKLDARRRQVDALLDLVRIQAIVESRVQALFRAQDLHGITPAQANVLMALFQAKGPLTARAIHRRLGVSEATISRFVKALQANGWVARERDPNDGRAMLVVATEQAYAALPRFIHVSNQLLDEAFADMPPAQLEALGVGVRAVTRNLVED